MTFHMPCFLLNYKLSLKNNAPNPERSNLRFVNIFLTSARAKMRVFLTSARARMHVFLTSAHAGGMARRARRGGEKRDTDSNTLELECSLCKVR